MIHFFYGENEFEIAREIAKMRENFLRENAENSVEKFDVSDDEIDKIFTEIINVNLFFSRRFFVIKNVFSNKIFAEKLADFLPRIPDENAMILVDEKPDKRTKIFKELLKKTDAREFKILRDFELKNWLSTEVKTRKIPLNLEAENELLRLTSGEENAQNRIAQELEKFEILAHENARKNAEKNAKNLENSEKLGEIFDEKNAKNFGGNLANLNEKNLRENSKIFNENLKNSDEIFDEKMNEKMKAKNEKNENSGAKNFEINAQKVREIVEPNLSANAFEILNLALSKNENFAQKNSRNSRGNSEKKFEKNDENFAENHSENSGKNLQNPVENLRENSAKIAREKLQNEIKILRESGEDANRFLGLLSSQIFALAAATFERENAKIDAAKTLKIHPFQMAKAREILRKLGDEKTREIRVKNLVKNLAETDAKMKISGAENAWKLVEIMLMKM